MCVPRATSFGRLMEIFPPPPPQAEVQRRSGFDCPKERAGWGGATEQRFENGGKGEEEAVGRRLSSGPAAEFSDFYSVHTLSLIRMSVNMMIYETQFFGFTPHTCMMRMYLAFQDHLFHMMLVVEEVIRKKLENMRYTKLTSSSIRRSSEKFLAYMRKHFDQLFGKMEQLLLQVVLSIPENVLLPEDKFQDQYSYSVSEFQELQDEIHHLEHCIRAETSAQQALKAELEEQKATQEQLEKILQWFDGLDSMCREHGTSSFKEGFAFLKGNATKLQAVMQEVQDKSKKLHKK